MATKIALAGATGNLGGRVVRELLKRDADVRAIVRDSTPEEKRKSLRDLGVEVVQVDYEDLDTVTRALADRTCVISTLSGLRDVIVQGQTALLQGAVRAEVPRFIPSDFAADFTKTQEGENRNFDLRREFMRRLDEAPIAATSILNGAFMDMLLGGMPMLDLERGTVSYWENPDQPLDFTTMDDTAAYTAEVALDSATPRFLHIKGDSLSAKGLRAVVEAASGQSFDLKDEGSLNELAEAIAGLRSASPATENELYPQWQGMQYLLSMFSGHAALSGSDNGRYPNLRWTKVEELLRNAPSQ